MTKKEIYAKYGIEFKDGKINHPVLGWVRLPIVNGNAKIGKGCWHFSTLPTNKPYTVKINGIEYHILGTCPLHCKGCYATSGNYRFQSCVNALGMRTWLVQNDVDFLERAIMAQIEADKIAVLRIHAAGDFFSWAYVQMWQRIARKNPAVIMWTYTKKEQAEKAFDDIENVNIVKSIIKGYGFNFGHCDYVMETYKALKENGENVYICKCGTDKQQHCINCGACRTNKYVLFIEHSTEYKAEKDPLYSTLKALIESQKDIELR